MRIVTTVGVFVVCCIGCTTHAPQVTSVPLSPWNQGEAEGMPFYLPKPLLVVAKNVRHVDASKVGLTNSSPIPNAFDDQASYADIKANVSVPGGDGGEKQVVATDGTSRPKTKEEFDKIANALPSCLDETITPATTPRLEDGLSNDSFFTYQIVFVPDLNQKYGLKVRGKPGEVRAAMNLVNGWMYTGMGPYYLKDSSTAQNIMAVGVASMFAGRGAANVLNSVSGLAGANLSGAEAGGAERANVDGDDFVDRATRVLRALQSETRVPQEMLQFAEVSIYEPRLNERGTATDWHLIAHHEFDRHFFAPGTTDTARQVLEEILKGDWTESNVASPGASVENETDNPPGPEFNRPNDDIEDPARHDSPMSSETLPSPDRGP